MFRVCISQDTGGGRFGGHLTQYAFTGLPGAEVAALADSNPEAEKRYQLTGAKKLYRSFTEMVEREKPDIVVLCSRLPGEHCEQMKFALSRGCHVLCEKPLAETLPQADELAALAHETGKLVQMAHLARFAPAFREMKRMIGAGEIGRVLTCYLRGKEDCRGGGEDMMVLGTHILDAAAWIFGMPEQVWSDIRWQGRPITARDVLETSEPVGLCGGDEVFSLYRFPGGVNGVFESRRVIKKGADRFGITVCGTAGTLSIRYIGDRALRICRDFPTPPEDQAAFRTVELPEVPPIPGAFPLDHERLGIDMARGDHRYFAENNRRAAWNLLRAIEGKEPLTAGIDSALASLEMITGAYRSAVDRAPVVFPLVDRRHPLEAKKGETSE
jgi:predicted dehydrogenase